MMPAMPGRVMVISNAEIRQMVRQTYRARARAAARPGIQKMAIIRAAMAAMETAPA